MSWWILTALAGGAPGWSPAAVDEAADPCVDFYRFACGGPRAPRASLAALARANDEALARALRKDPGPGGALFRECTDLDAIETAGFGPLAPWLDLVGSVDDADGALRAAGVLRTIGVAAIVGGERFGDTVVLRPLRCDDRLPDTSRLIGALLAASGETDPARAAEAIELGEALCHLEPSEEQRAALSSLGEDDARDRALAALRPFLDGAGLAASEVSPDPIGGPAAVELLRATPPQALRSYLRGRLLLQTALYLHEAARGPVLDWAKGTFELPDRTSFCLDAVGRVAPGATAAAWPRGDAELGDEVRSLLAPVHREFVTAVHEVERRWTNDGWPTSDPADVRFGLVVPPPTVPLATTGSWFADWAAARKVAPADLGASPIHEPNAAWEQSTRTVLLTPGILALFDPRASDAASFGAAGSVVGHELTHGYFGPVWANVALAATLLRSLGPDVQVEPLAVDEDPDSAIARLGCVSSQLAEVDPGPGVITDANEAASDLGGLELAWRAWRATRPRSGTEAGRPLEQVFFLSFAQTFCEAGGHDDDPHPPGTYRVNATVRQFEEFAEAFSCEEGRDPMASGSDCRIW